MLLQEGVEIKVNPQKCQSASKQHSSVHKGHSSSLQYLGIGNIRILDVIFQEMPAEVLICLF